MTTIKGYEQHDEDIEIPKGAGIDGFLAAIRAVLKLPRVQDIRIDARGKISYSFLLRAGEAKQTLGVNFDDLMPYAVVRNADVQELILVNENAAVALLQMFRQVSIEHVYPVAFVVGAATTFWEWYEASTLMKAEIRDEVLSVPIFRDRACPDDVLLLCTSFRVGEPLSATQKVYKVQIPQVPT